METSNGFFNIQIKLSYVTWIVIIFIALFLNTFNSKSKYKRTLEKERKEHIKEIKSDIKMRESLISIYEIKIKNNEAKINTLGKQIDSINIKKQKVEIIYRDRIIKVKEMDSKGLNNYWNEAFN